jgi:hypothetical protein
VRWAASVLAYRNGAVRHPVMIVEAPSRDEARSKALRCGLKAFPPERGWHSHHVTVGDASILVDPDLPVELA